MKQYLKSLKSIGHAELKQEMFERMKRLCGIFGEHFSLYRTFDKEEYILFTAHKTKYKATLEAEIIRTKNYKARIVHSYYKTAFLIYIRDKYYRGSYHLL